MLIHVVKKGEEKGKRKNGGEADNLGVTIFGVRLEVQLCHLVGGVLVFKIF